MKQPYTPLLKAIYDHQTLTLAQAVSFFKPDNLTAQEMVQFLATLKENSLITVDESKDKKNPNLCLTSKGIDHVKGAYHLPNNVFSPSKQLLYRGYLRASELKPKHKQMDRQNRLNNFALLLKKNADKRHWVNLHYCDRKFIPASYPYVGAQAFFQLNGVSFFVHVEGKEYSETGLEKLFNPYKELTEPINQTLESDVVILVIASSADRAIQWKRALHTFSRTITSSHIDLIIDTQSEILSYLFKQLIPQLQQQSPLIVQTQQATTQQSHLIEPVDLRAYDLIGRYHGILRSETTHRNTLITYYDTKTQASLQAYLNHLDNHQTLIEAGYPETVVLITSDLDAFHQDLLQIPKHELALCTPLSYATTPERLSQASTWEEAIVQFNRAGFEPAILPPIRKNPLE